MGRYAVIRVLPLLSGLLGLVGVATPERTAAAVAVEYRTSHMLGLSLFASTIAGAPNRPPALRDVFTKSPYNTPEAQALIAEFRELHRGLQEGVDFAGGPTDRPSGVTLEQLFLWRALEADDLRELRRTTQALMPLSRQSRYFQILAALEGIYDPLVWEPCRETLERYRTDLENKSREWGMEPMFASASRFYGADWPPDLPFTIALYPIPGREGGTSAESLGSLETVAVLVDETDHTGRFGVIFHEMCHSLYEAQPAAFQGEMAGWFREQETPHAALAASMINEGLATAVGNGWAAALASGKLDGGEWYNDSMIDGYAKALHPMVADYLDQGKAIDREFVRRSVEAFRAAFPDAPDRLDLLLREIVLMTDGETVTPVAAREALRAHFRISSIYACAPVDDPESLKLMNDHPATLVVMLGAAQADQLTALAASLPSLAPKLEEVRGARDAVLFTGREGIRAVVVLKVRSAESLPEAADALRKAETINGETGRLLPLD